MLRIDRSSKNPKLISIFTGDICNLACVLCDPLASTRWQYEINLQKKQQKNEVDMDSFDFTNVDSVTFGGGEPVLNKVTLPILKKISNSTPVLIHLNGTILPSQELLNECSKFNQITFSFSIDDIEEQFEFLRYPAKWDKVVKNILWLRDNCAPNVKFGFNTVVSVLNKSTYTRVEEWGKKHMPINTEYYINDSNGRLNQFSYKNTLAEDIVFLDNLDKKRNTNWRQLFPTAANLLESNFKPAKKFVYFVCD